MMEDKSLERGMTDSKTAMMAGIALCPRNRASSRFNKHGEVTCPECLPLVQAILSYASDKDKQLASLRQENDDLKSDWKELHLVSQEIAIEKSKLQLENGVMREALEKIADYSDEFSSTRVALAALNEIKETK